MAQYNFPVWATQGGGLVRELSKDKYIFVEAPPDGMGLGVGDEMPEEWGIIPANDLACYEIDHDEFPLPALPPIRPIPVTF